MQLGQHWGAATSHTAMPLPTSFAVTLCIPRLSRSLQPLLSPSPLRAAWPRSGPAGAVAHVPLQLVEGDQIQLQVDLVPFYQPQQRIVSPEAPSGLCWRWGRLAWGSQPKNTYFLTFHSTGRLHMGI